MQNWRNILIRGIYYICLIGIPWKIVQYYRENNIPFTVWHLVFIILLCVFLLWLGFKIEKQSKNTN
jgi:hypothetical protein